ncbi:Hypothetical predicted protein [Paramuricea clavata]|uniref:Uncharacterized protein n=1 Tax=Paramuricea clavata TaxID=317549 RepID=A0A6S7GZB9_PARCT|nr:Hypothetical predicted protein [Paramuricea clavata]
MKKNKDMEEAEFIKAIVLFDCDDADTLETLALVVGLSSVGKHWALRANSFSLCIQCFRGIEENHSYDFSAK